MTLVTSDGARISWTAQGTGTPVLLIMGHLYSSHMWYSLIPLLTRSHRVITFDNRGTGGSDTTAGLTMEQLAADAIAVLDAAGERRAHVYGVSMGGAVAAEVGMAHPERLLSLTLGCTMLKTERTFRPLAARMLYRLPARLLRWLLLSRAGVTDYGTAVPEDWARRDLLEMQQNRFTTRGLREQAKAIAEYATSWERARRNLTMPVLILHGDEDTAVPVGRGRELHRFIPGSRYVEFPGAGHNYLIASGGAANSIFVDFVNDVDASAQSLR